MLQILYELVERLTSVVLLACLNEAGCEVIVSVGALLGFRALLQVFLLLEAT